MLFRSPLDEPSSEAPMLPMSEFGIRCRSSALCESLSVKSTVSETGAVVRAPICRYGNLLLTLRMNGLPIAAICAVVIFSWTAEQAFARGGGHWSWKDVQFVEMLFILPASLLVAFLLAPALLAYAMYTYIATGQNDRLPDLIWSSFFFVTLSIVAWIDIISRMRDIIMSSARVRNASRRRKQNKL